MLAKERTKLSSRTLPNFLPRRLHRCDVSDYLLSNTFTRKFGEEFSRRDALVRLAAAAGLIALPIRPARAVSISTILEITKGTIEVAIAGLELLDHMFTVKEHTSGQCNTENRKDQAE